MTLEKWRSGTGQALLVHERNKNCDEGCVIHNPTDHALLKYPTFWRSDRGLMERICSHGVGHPDPDDIAFKAKTMGEKHAHFETVHGCDGCCRGVVYAGADYIDA